MGVISTEQKPVPFNYEEIKKHVDKEEDDDEPLIQF